MSQRPEGVGGKAPEQEAGVKNQPGSAQTSVRFYNLTKEAVFNPFWVAKRLEVHGNRDMTPRPCGTCDCIIRTEDHLTVKPTC